MVLNSSKSSLSSPLASALLMNDLRFISGLECNSETMAAYSFEREMKPSPLISYSLTSIMIASKAAKSIFFSSVPVPS